MMKKPGKIVILIILSLVCLTACGKKTIPQVNTKTVDETTVTTTTSPMEEGEKQEVVLYFSDNDLLAIYRVKKEIVVGKEDNVAKVALEAWVAGPENEEMLGLIHPKTMIERIDEIDGVAHVSFSKEIKESNLGSSGELMLIEQISMIMQQFGYEQTQILVEGLAIETLLGHVNTDKPIVANDSENYRWIDEKDTREIVIQNKAFQIYEPTPDAQVGNSIVVRGLARVYEGTVLYEFEDGHSVLDSGFTTATKAAPGWGEFEVVIEYDGVTNNTGMIILYEESAEDGSRINELIIPVKVK